MWWCSFTNKKSWLMNVFRSLDNFKKYHWLCFTFRIEQDHDSARQYLYYFYRKIMHKNLVSIWFDNNNIFNDVKNYKKYIIVTIQIKKYATSKYFEVWECSEGPDIWALMSNRAQSARKHEHHESWCSESLDIWALMLNRAQNAQNYKQHEQERAQRAQGYEQHEHQNEAQVYKIETRHS